MEAQSSTMRCLVINEVGKPLQVETWPVPQAGSGSAVVQVLSTAVMSYIGDIYSGARKYPFPTPMITGTGGVGRVVAVGPDATQLKPGKLVFISSLIRSRDDFNDAFLMGIHSGWNPKSSPLMEKEWRGGSFAEYVKAPLEALFELDEERLLGSPRDGGFGYTVDDLAFLPQLLVAFGGLEDINLQAGERLLVSPATGGFGCGAVHVALAMGADIVAMGRKPEKLQMLVDSVFKHTGKRIQTALMTGDVKQEEAEITKGGPIDAFFDISPPEARESTHIKSGIHALRPRGRVSLMGGIKGDYPFPHNTVMHNELAVRGKWMAERNDIIRCIKLVERGHLKLGQEAGITLLARYSLDQWDEALDLAKRSLDIGPLSFVVFNP